MKKPSLEYSKKTNPLVWWIRVVLVVVLAFAAFRFLQPDASSGVPVVLAPVVPAAVETSTTTLALVNENAVTLVDLNGEAKRMTSEEFVNVHPSSTWPRDGVQVSNGQWVSFKMPAQVASGTRGLFPSTDGTWVASSGSVKSDGASVIRIVSKAKTKDLVFRQPGGAPIKDASIVGWFDDATMMLTGHVTSTSWLYAFSVQGVVQPIEQLPETIVLSQVRNGELWYTTAVQGEGIESNPVGPSDVHRVVIHPAVKDTIEHHEDTKVVIGLTGTNPLAFTLDTGESFWQDISIGSRRPLLVLPDQRLIVRDGFDLIIFDPKTGATRRLVAVPEGSVTMFLMP